MTPEDLLRQLAERHEFHLRWLRRRLGSTVAAEDVEDFVQGAYDRALTALRDRASAPSFDDPRRADAWLRTIALNLALDTIRQRRGRSRDNGAGRLQPVSLDADDVPSLPDGRVPIEDEVLESLERDARRQVIADAIGTLDAGHRQILQLRYGRGLDPQAIMVLEGLNRRQWDGRHTRAIKAFGRALARHHISSECGRTRRLLRRSPGELLGHGHAPARDHVADCVACGAFARAAQFALAMPPLPSAIAAWRYEAAERLVRARRPDAPEPSGGHADWTPADLLRTAEVKLVAAITATAFGIFAMAGVDRSHGTATDPEADTRTSRRIPPDSGLALAAHETPAQALTRSAREMARARARAARTAGGSDGSAGPRPSRSQAAHLRNPLGAAEPARARR